MTTVEAIWMAAAVFGAFGIMLIASAAVVVVFQAWREPVRASRDAYRTACLLDHVASGAPLPRVKSRRSARAWAHTSARLAEILAGTEGEALGQLADKYGKLSPSSHQPARLRIPGGDGGLNLSIPQLNVLARSIDLPDRRKALRALVSLGHPDAISTLLVALRDVDPECRCLALAGLADLRASGATDRIAEMVDDPSWRVRDAARRAFTQLAEQPPQASQSGVVQWI